MGFSLSLCWASHSWPEVVAFEPLLQFSDPLGACNVVLLFPVAGGWGSEHWGLLGERRPQGKHRPL